MLFSPVNLSYKRENFEQNLKIQKSKMAAAWDIIYLTIVAKETN